MLQALRVHYFQHIRSEGYGSPEVYLKQKGAVITATRFFELEKGQPVQNLPDYDEVDLLIIMGGAMSVNDEAIYPWLKQEKQWIGEFIARDKPIVGLCLGGQLIATSLGATVKRNLVQELGWWPIYATTARKQATYPVFEFPQQLTAMSWHNETFELPEGAILLAENQACPRQAYQYKHNVLAFQFHPEITPRTLDLYLEDKDEVSEFSGQYVQSYQQLKQTPADQFKPANAMLNRAIDFVLATTP